MSNRSQTCFLLGLFVPLAVACNGGKDTTTAESDTAAFCGNGVTDEGESCDDGAESATCNADCTPAACGDGTVNVAAGEICDDQGESLTCDVDCTPAACGDGTVNPTAGELCEPATDELWERCPLCIVYGAGLDGTFGTKWEPLAVDKKDWDDVAGLPSFHYSSQPALYELTYGKKYDIAANTWTSLTAVAPFGLSYWVNGAVDETYIWIARASTMYRFDMTTETWDEGPGKKLPNGTISEGATIFDGHGMIWYHADDTLVRYNPQTGDYTAFSYAPAYAGFDAYETRVAYDPVGDRVAFTGFENDRFLIFDLASQTFSEGAPSPDGAVHDNSCQDRSGGIYTGSGDYTKMYRYDIGSDAWDVLPELPLLHDNNSSCVVSQDGYLYYGTTEVPGGFYRLPLGVVGL